jgi:opacity protein-like surface antigen
MSNSSPRLRRIPQPVRLLACLTFAAALILSCCTQAATAQAVPTATGPGPYIAVGGTIAAFKLNFGQRTVGGGSIYVDLHPHKTYGIEVEAKTFRYNQENDVRQSTLLAGPRYSIGSGRALPFVKVLAGVGRFEFPYRYATGNYFVIAPGAGLDYQLNRRLKVRVLQFEYQSWPQFTYGNLHAYGLSTGISLRVF